MDPGEKYAESVSSQTPQQGEMPIVKTLYVPEGIGPSRANRIVAELVLQYGGGHAQYVPAQNAIVVRGSAEEIATGQHLIDLASRTSLHTAASAPEPKGMVTMARETTTNSRGGKTVFGILETTQKWLNEDVVYIITDEERDTFLHLKNDEERQQFITAFWERRNPNPGSADNKFKDEHYRRIAYANEHFATPSGKPGWQTDRGHIYIVYGPPDTRSEFLPGENGSQFATEVWRYNHIEGVGDNLSFEFVSRGGDGDFTLAPGPSSAQAAPEPGDSNASTQPDWNARHGVTILSSTEGVDFQPYINAMLKSVQSHWMSVMPQEATEGKTRGQVSVTFR